MDKSHKSGLWKTEESTRLDKFVLANRLEIKANFYKNLFCQNTTLRRRNTFFSDMGKFVGISPDLCKSKFQKLEEFYFLDVLLIPKEHYSIYLRQKKRFHKGKNQIKCFHGKRKTELYIYSFTSRGSVSDLSENDSLLKPPYF